MVLDSPAIRDIEWRRDNVTNSFELFALSNPKLSMSSDACKYGWSAVCSGHVTSGFFSDEEYFLHINVKELLACSLGLRSFFRSLSLIVIYYS